eukprot:2402064-Rhodomonas_salina.2
MPRLPLPRATLCQEVEPRHASQRPQSRVTATEADSHNVSATVSPGPVAPNFGTPAGALRVSLRGTRHGRGLGSRFSDAVPESRAVVDDDNPEPVPSVEHRGLGPPRPRAPVEALDLREAARALVRPSNHIQPVGAPRPPILVWLARREHRRRSPRSSLRHPGPLRPDLAVPHHGVGEKLIVREAAEDPELAHVRRGCRSVDSLREVLGERLPLGPVEDFHRRPLVSADHEDLFVEDRGCEPGPLLLCALVCVALAALLLPPHRALEPPLRLRPRVYTFH